MGGDIISNIAKGTLNNWLLVNSSCIHVDVAEPLPQNIKRQAPIPRWQAGEKRPDRPYPSKIKPRWALVISPHEGIGGCVSEPRKLKPASGEYGGYKIFGRRNNGRFITLGNICPADPCGHCCNKVHASFYAFAANAEGTPRTCLATHPHGKTNRYKRLSNSFAQRQCNGDHEQNGWNAPHHIGKTT